MLGTNLQQKSSLNEETQYLDEHGVYDVTTYYLVAHGT